MLTQLKFAGFLALVSGSQICEAFGTDLSAETLPQLEFVSSLALDPGDAMDGRANCDMHGTLRLERTATVIVTLTVTVTVTVTVTIAVI